ncbi:nucleotide exchange factor GrpE [Macrococcoides bohemicum]|uniref:Protein GrpE n=1 Tax=Macrococcoides bohemicum TaxID=1903056 RepID=A0AAE7U9U5_9STAP|nr:nucleotide exchange factor GrpE [Macrococcus bohemicus]MBC9873162.1 nucleotide exchange factor GrpE [Macrococcus bohemicus]QRN50127.1 nucleotide exchange factor GrpE [Macrococcus bohemicus]QYA41559.1 nucleotide exchange factor GrpE [Macrococcus bohemicus]QYA43984.1 nucleotide exchange factor GrpE [Macrococcus bohemicus]
MSEKHEEQVYEKTDQTDESNETVEQDMTEKVAPEAPVEASEEETTDELTETKQLLEAAEEKYLRLYAEFENYKKRTRAELDTERTYRAQSVLRDILPAIDNIERALAQKGESEEFKSLHKGVEMVYESLLSSLKDNGLEVIEALDKPFDPNLHQAVMQEQDQDKASGIVLDELQKGYKLKERVLRPSMVKVNE